jgi:hypothetical protein
MIHVVAMKCLIGLPLLIRIEILQRSQSRSGVSKFEKSESESEVFMYRLHRPGIMYGVTGLNVDSLHIST